MRVWGLNKLMRAVRLWRDGATIREIADALNVPPQEVRDHLPEMQKYGLEKF